MLVKNILVGLLIGLANGFFGSGGGVAAVLALKKLCALEEKKAHATAIAVILPLCVLSIFFYKSAGYANWALIIKASLGGVLGGALGAFLLSKLTNRLIKGAFGAVMLVAAIRLW